MVDETIQINDTHLQDGGSAQSQKKFEHTSGTDIQADIQNVLKSIQIPTRNERRMISDIQDVPAVSQPLPPVSDPVATPTPGLSSVMALHTLKDDMQQVVRSQNISLVRAAALEQDKLSSHQSQTFSSPARTSRNNYFTTIVFVSILLVVLAGAALFGVAYVVQNRSLPQQSTEQSIVFSERSVVVQIGRAQPGALKTALAGARSDTSDAVGAITRIIPILSTSTGQTSLANSEATLGEFFDALGIQAPDELLRNLDSRFFFGFHMMDHRAPVFVIPVVSYDHAVSGMLSWEKLMNQDLSPIFTSISPVKNGPSGIPVDRLFRDTVMHNYDVRVLEDDAGNPILYYAFPSQSVLVIAENPFTFPEIISRLHAQKGL